MKRKKFNLKYANAYHIDEALRNIRHDIWEAKPYTVDDDPLVAYVERRYLTLLGGLMAYTDEHTEAIRRELQSCW